MNLLAATSPFFRWVILINVTFATIIGVISATGGFVADSTVRGALMLSSDNEKWIAISFIMMLGITLPYAIWLAERFGYKRLFFAGTLVFVFGSLLNSFSFDFWSLLISRAIAGAGAGALFPISVAVIDQTFPKEKLTMAVSLYVGIGFGGGTLLAFLISGYMTQYLSWNSLFFLCFLLGIPTLIATWLFHVETPGKKNEQFDYAGYGSFIIFISTLLLILNSAKAEWNTDGWHSTFMYWCYALNIVSFIAMIIVELKSPYPIIHFSIFKIKSFLLGCISIFFIGAVLYANQLFSVVFLDQDLGYEKHLVGTTLALSGLTFGIVGAIVPILTKKIRIRLLTLIGMILVTFSCWLNTGITMYSSHAQMQWMWNLRMVGVGLSIGPATALALSETPLALSGAASVLIILARQVGGTIGSLLAGVIITERTVFHSARFGTQIDVMAPRFEQVSNHLQAHLIRDSGNLPLEAKTQAADLLRANVFTQAHVTAMADAFLILGTITGLITLGLIFEWIIDASKTPAAQK